VSAREAGRSETPVASTSPVTDVSESVVRVKVPLPTGPHPSAVRAERPREFSYKRAPDL
jgi:hypothetical protein